MKSLFLSIMLIGSLYGANVTIESGSIKAHTEMLMDSNIDIYNKNIKSDLHMDGMDIATLRGKLSFDMKLFASSEADRDEHMYEVIELPLFPSASYTITNITKSSEGDNKYILDGTLEFHGKTKEISVVSEMALSENKLSLKANSFFEASDFGVEMPCMVFMCVRDKVDIDADIVLVVSK